MKLLTEVFVSTDGQEFNKIDLSNTDSILMKYVYKDTTELSKIFSPYSLSFTFPGTPNNQKIFGFIENTKVVKAQNKNVFDCKIYINGAIFQIGKLKITELREFAGRVQTYTANFTTTMLSLSTRMGDDLINDLPENPCVINWSPNEVFGAVQSVKVAPIQPRTGITAKYYVPLISNNRVFQHNPNINENFADNVAYNPAADPSGNNVIKSEELTPAVQGRTIIDMIKAKYGLNIVMPLEDTKEYNEWYVYCNSAKTNPITPITFDAIVPFGDLQLYNAKNAFHIPFPRKYEISVNTSTDLFDIERFAASPDYYDEIRFSVILNNVTATKSADTVSASFILELENGNIKEQKTIAVDDSGKMTAAFVISDYDFTADHFKFKVKLLPDTPIVWLNCDFRIDYGYRDGKFGPLNQTSYGSFRQISSGNDNSAIMGGSKIDLYKSIPETKCADFLNSFFKMFNISVFNSSPNDDRLFWLTPKDLEAQNKEYSPKEVDYTPYIVSKSIIKSRAAEYNYYNFKHKTSKYKSSVDYLAANGYEFGQLVYPEIKPEGELDEFKVETIFSLLPRVQIPGIPGSSTSYAFTSDSPTILETGEYRYKPNTDDLTILFSTFIQSLSPFPMIGGGYTKDYRINFQTFGATNNLTISPLNSYIISSPINKNGFSFGFGLIETATQRSLYFDFYKKQTERLLSANTLQQKFSLKLPAKELALNQVNAMQGQSQIPEGFRLQNELILQESRFTIIDAQIDITTGNTDITLLNY